MYNLQEICQKGKFFRQQFTEIDFVGEIEIPESELENLCLSLWKYLQFTYNNEDLSALLTTVVVNLAYYTREDLNSNSLRWLILNKLSNSNLEDAAIWENSVGFPVLRVLMSHFHIQDIAGPNRFVRPILQQAGVPFSAIPQFVKFFLQLINSYGLPLTHQNYRRHKENHQIQSGILSSFLESEAGFRYCQEIGRIYKNFRNRLLNASEIEELPPRIRETIKALQRTGVEMPSSQVKDSITTSPQLVLDKEQLRLKLIFPDVVLQTTQLSHELRDIGNIYQNSYFLQPEDLVKGEISGITRYKGKSEEWEVKIWQPQISPWAVFSVSSGNFIQSVGKIDAGEYLIVMPDNYKLPEVIEDYGYFYSPGSVAYKVFHAQLHDGFKIPEIEFEIGSNPSAIPHLKFLDSKNLVRFGTNVFCEKAPTIVIGNWNENTLRDYFLLMKKDGVITRISDSQVTEGELNYQFDYPTQVQIKLEPKGKTIKGFKESSLFFTVVPKDFQFSWRSILYGKDATPNLTLQPAEKIEILKNNNSINHLNSEQYKVLPKVDILDLLLKYLNFPVFSLSIPVYRLNFTGEIIKDGMLWQENLNQRSNIFISFSPNERRQNVEVGIIVAGRFTKICDTKPVPNSLVLELTTDEIKNAFEDCGFAAGVIAIKTRSGNIVHSDVVYANDDLIKRYTFEEDRKFKEWSELLPDDLRLSLEGKRKSHLINNLQSDELPESVPDSLKDWLEDCHQDFQVIRKSLREWSEFCRNQRWQKAQQTEIGGEPDGKKLIEAVVIYHDALLALENNNAVKYNRFLENSYHKLQNVASAEGLISQIALFLRFICCLRLNEFESAKKESRLFTDSWSGILIKLRKNFLSNLPEIVNAEETYMIEDILVHNKDLELFNMD